MYKDVVYHKLKKFYRTDLKNHPIIPAIGLDRIIFDTLDNVFSGGNSQPIIYSNNIHNVLELAKQEKRGVDVLGGICMFGYGRIAVTNGKYRLDLWVLPKEVDKEGDWRISDYYDTSNFPKKWTNELFSLDVSSAGLEPTLGRIVKIFNILEAVSQFSKKVNFMLPTQEYLNVRRYNALRLGLSEDDLGKLEKTHIDIAEKYKKVIGAIQQNFFSGLQVSVESSHEIKNQVDRIAGTKKLKEAISSLGKFSYHTKGANTEQYIEEERRYISLLLRRSEGLLVKKDSPSRIIVMNARDIDSFLLQSMYVFDQMSPRNVNVKDRIAFVGVGGGPSITREGSNELLCPLDFQDATFDDYFGKAPKQVLSLSEDLKTTKLKLEMRHAERSNTSPIFFYLSNLRGYLGRNDLDSLLRDWKEGRPNEELARKKLLHIIADLKKILDL